MTCLAVLIPFGASRNVDMQGYVLIIAGGCAWASVVLARQPVRLQAMQRTLLVIIALSCLVSLVANPHRYYDLVGSPYIRLGSAGLLACIGCGWLLQRFKPKQLVTYLYVGITTLAVVSLPYSWIKFDTLTRFGGVFAQANIMAAFLGCGLLLGLFLSTYHSEQRRYVLTAQLLMSVLLLLSETRAVIFLTVALSIIWLAHNTSIGVWKVYSLGLVSVLVLFAMMHFLLADRLTNLGYASQSVDYRLQLQTAGLKTTTNKPVTGYGLGNLADALDCRELMAAELQKTCRDNYFFNSSHNIFIDRVLGLGWLGGLAYLGFVILAVWQGLRSRPEIRILGFCALLVGLYYLTNVTSVTLELLFWILLLQCFSGARTIKR